MNELNRTVRLRGRPVVYSQYGTHESLCLTPPYHTSKDEHESIKWVEVMSKTVSRVFEIRGRVLLCHTHSYIMLNDTYCVKLIQTEPTAARGGDTGYTEGY